MSKAEELSKHTLNLFPGDYARIQALYPEIGAGPIIRQVLRAWLDKVESGDAQAPTVEVKI